MDKLSATSTGPRSNLLGSKTDRATTSSIVPAPQRDSRYDSSGVERGADGIARYRGLPDSLVHLLRASVDSDRSACALVHAGSGSLTYGELWERCARVAGGLRADGVSRGERVVIRMPNSVEWVLAFLGAQLAGAVPVPVNSRLTDEEVRYIVKDSGASAVIDAGAELPNGKPYVIEDLRLDDLAAIFYTSGTTGAPKGAMLSHANFLTSSENCLRVLGAERSRRAEMSSLVGVPLFHVVACNSQLIPIVQTGGRVEILDSPLDFDGVCRAVAENGVRHIVSVPAVFHALVHHPRFAELDVSGVTWVSYGGSPITADLVREIREAFPGAQGGNGFGLTECSGMATFLPAEESLSQSDSVGYAMPVIDLALLEADPRSGVGELLIRGANVAQGYWRAPAATAETFADGWLHSGDLARLDDDGRVYIVDRKKDMISRGAENVYSLEVEKVLAAAPGVAEAAVIPVPDEMMGEKVGAVIVHAAGVELDVGAVIAYCGERLADFKLPQYVVVSGDRLPRNAAGKILKTALRTRTRWGKPIG